MKIIRNPRRIANLLEIYNVFDYITDKDTEIFAVEYEAGEYVRHPGMETGADWLQYVVKGKLQLFLLAQDGNVISERYGEWHCHIGESEMILNDDFGLFAKAYTKVTVLAVSAKRYREALMNDRKFLKSALISQTKLLKEQAEKDLVSLPLSERVLNAMRYHCPDYTLKGVELQATVFHCSARQLQRVLNDLAEQNKIVKTGKGTYRLIV